MQIELSELIKSVTQGSDAGPPPFEVGKSYLIRTVTHYDLGRVVRVTGGFVVLGEASWVPDTGRFANALATGELSELEPAWNKSRECIVSIGAIVDAWEGDHALPTEQV